MSSKCVVWSKKVVGLEPLTRAIKVNPNIKGYLKGEEGFKLSIYVDDVLMFLPDPLVSLPSLVMVLTRVP